MRPDILLFSLISLLFYPISLLFSLILLVPWCYGILP